jgi:hypothetical protein
VPHTYIDTYGVKLDVEVQDEALQPAVERILPPGWQPSNDFPEDGHFTLSPGVNGSYSVSVDGAPIATDLAPDVAVHVLDSQLRSRVAVLAHDRIFVHAGVAAFAEQALLLPGTSFCGKSTLVAALVSAGATYYSDEFAVLDEHGLVHPYPRPLSLRSDDGERAGYATAETLGGRSGTAPIRTAMILITRYVPGAALDLQERTPALGALALLTNAVPARPRTEATLAAISRAAADAVVLEGDRGEAPEVAAMLKAALEARQI